MGVLWRLDCNGLHTGAHGAQIAERRRSWGTEFAVFFRIFLFHTQPAWFSTHGRHFFSHATTMSNEKPPDFPFPLKTCLFLPPTTSPAAFSTAGLADALGFTLQYLQTLMTAQENPEIIRPAVTNLLDHFLKTDLITHLVPAVNPPAAPVLTPPTDYSHLLGKITALETSIATLVKASALSRKVESTPSTQKPLQNAPMPMQPKRAGSAPPTYAKVASAPLHPSVVVSTTAFTWPDTGRPKVSDVCKFLNERLAQSAHSQVHVSAARWTARGNLVLWGGPNNTLALLSSALGYISKALFDTFSASAFSSPDSPPQIRPNVRWSKLLINRVPTGKSSDHEVFTPEECHQALLTENPSYASLSITQRPSWVRSPSLYKDGAVSSLSLSFEDPDGSRAQALIASRTLFIFGSVAVVKKWKQKPPPPKPIPEKGSDSLKPVPPLTSKRPPTSPPQMAAPPSTKRKVRPTKAGAGT